MYKQLKRNKGGLARMAGGGQPSKVLSGNIMAGASWNSLNNLLVNDLTQATGQPTTNTAVGGATTSDTYKQLMDFINDGGSFDPDATVFLQTGGVDFLKGVPKDEIKSNIDKILSTLEAQGVNVVLTGSPYAASMEDVVSNNFDPKIDPLFQEIADKHKNVAVVDSMGDILQDKSLLSDNLHPNEVGTRRYNDDVLGALNQLKQREEPQDQGGTQETIKDTAVDIPQEIERITQTNIPEEQYTPIAEAEEPVNIAEEIERITNKPEVTQPEVVEQTYTPPPTIQETASVPYEPQEIASTPERQPEVVETRSGPDYSRAYGALGGEEVVNNLYKQFLGMGLDEDTISSVFSKYYSPEAQEAKKGGAIRMQVGGLTGIANLGKAGTKLSKAEIASLRARGMGVPSIDFADPMNPKDIMRMSEALGASGSEGKTLNLTQADRSRVFGPNKGGTGFSGLQLTSPAHKQAGTTWGVGKPSHVTRMVNANTPETVWSPFIGSPTQHMSNPVTVERMYEAHKNASPSAELVDKMNKQLNSAIHAKTKKPIFPSGIDISDPASLNQAKTFDQRKAIAQALTIGGEKKGEKATQEAFKIIKEETDPLLMDAPTYAVGNRLFTIDKNTGIYRPDLNSAFPEQTVGTDFGLIFEPAPIQHAAPDFVKKFEGRKNKHGNPQPMGHKDLTATTPKQFISEEYLTNLQKAGYKEGGSAEPKPFHDFDQIMKRKDGGTVNQSFEQRLKSALNMAMGGEVSDNTMPDRTDSGNVNYGGQYAKGGLTRRYAEAGSVPAPTPQELEKMADAQGAAFGVFPQMASQRFQQRSPTMDKASEMLKAQVTKEWEQAGRPGGMKELSLRIGAVLAGQVPDLANLAQSVIPGLNKPSSVLDPEGEKVAKFPMSGTSADIKNAMRNKGMINEDEYPIAELAGAFGVPYAAVKAPRAIEGGLNAVTAAARRPFTPATMTTEAVSPDLAKFKNPAFQDYVTNQMIGEGAAVPMTTMGGRKTSQIRGQGVYLNEAKELEKNPMIGVNIPRAGNLATNKALRADIATAGQELGQEAMAAHRFVPMATNQIKDASAMMIRGQGGRPLTNKEVMAMANELPDMIVTHSPANGGLMVAPFGMTKGQVPEEFLTAQSVARKVLGKDAKIQFGKADPNKDLMYMMRHQYAEEGGRGTSQGAQDIRNKLKRMDKNFPLARQ